VPDAYPIMLDLTDRLVVIVGGGAVAVRKAVGVIECGATRVRCVAPKIDAQMPATVERVGVAYDVSHLDGAGLAFAATDDPAVNAAVVRDARARGVPVNRADSGEPGGDFATPARLKRGGVIFTVSAGSAALSAFIRDRVGRRWDPRWTRMADAMRRIRPDVVARQDIKPRRRRQVFRALASYEAMNVLTQSGEDALRTWLAVRFPEFNSHA
jgi:siroheme synthase-like protein